MKSLSKYDISNLDSLLDAGGDIGEVALDFALKLEGLLKDLPILGSFIKGLRVATGVSQLFLLYKVEQFRKEFDNISEKEKKAFADKMNKDAAYNKKVGTTVLLMLDKLNDVDKTPLVGKVYCELVKGNIDFPTVVRLTSIIESLTIYDLGSLKFAYQGSIMDKITQQILSNAGVMTLSEIDGGTIKFSGGVKGTPSFAINELGKLFVEICYPEARGIKEVVSRI
jgi:hypothetical protein